MDSNVQLAHDKCKISISEEEDSIWNAEISGYLFGWEKLITQLHIPHINNNGLKIKYKKIKSNSKKKGKTDIYIISGVWRLFLILKGANKISLRDLTTTTKKYFCVPSKYVQINIK